MVIRSREDAPKQGLEGAPEAWVDFDPAFAEALDGIAAGHEVVLLTWLHQGHRDVLQVHPRDDPQNPMKGVFAIRSSDRLNPSGRHRVRVLELAESVRLRVEPLEAVAGTPVVNVKPCYPARTTLEKKSGGVMSQQSDHRHGHTHGTIDPSIATTECGIWVVKWRIFSRSAQNLKDIAFTQRDN
jgi:tRNA-Thr(GGU) m(6)t(6)A37 methyltransferase TsaA